MSFIDGYWESSDGLRLHYRDHPGEADRAPVLCLAGLTRNARDYDSLAGRIAPGRRVIAVDFRGRGESAYAKDPLSYVPLIYAQDIERLIAELGLKRFVAIGTSLGGIVAMVLAATDPARIAGLVLNDVGPEIETAGLDRIRNYVGKGGAFPTWLHAARAIAELNAPVYPDYALADWVAMAKRLFRLTSAGRVVADYDKNIAAPFKLPGGEAGVDLWPVLERAGAAPVLVVRGALSDVLGDATVAKMCAKLPDCTSATVPRTGHAPTLDEPVAVAAIDALLARIP